MFEALFSTRWHCRLLPALLATFALFATTPVFAQSTVGMPANAAVGGSLADAIRQNDSDLISREVLDGGGGRSASSGTGMVGAFASGRLRRSDHDGLRPRSDTTPAYETDEASVFANVVTLPVPQGGWKESGVGTRSGGAPGIRKYCRPQAITATRLAPRSELLWYPYTPLKSKLFQRTTRLLLARDWSRRLGRHR